MIEAKTVPSERGGTYKKLEYTRTEDTPKVGIIYGHFAPFTGPNGHGRMLEKLQDFGCNRFIVAIPTSKQPFDLDRNMFSVDQRIEIIQAYLDDNYENSYAVIMKPTAPVAQIGRLGRKAYEIYGENINPIFCFGPDRADMIGMCEEYGGPDIHKYEAIVMTDRGENAVSGTKMRKYLIDGDRDSFMNDTGYDAQMTDLIFDMFEENKRKNLKESRRIKARLREGGNITVEGKDGAKSATKLQAYMMEPEEFENFKKDILQFLQEMNEDFRGYSGHPIWNDISVIMSGKAFSGSTRPMFQKDWKTFTTYKKTVGDLDVQLPSSVEPEFKNFLKEVLPGKTYNGLTIYGISETPGQGHCLLQCDSKYPGVGADYLQVDFEYTPFENDSPTDFATFAHYSSWEDIENNIKGVFIKYLMRALVSEVDTRDVMLVTKTGKPKRDKASLERMKKFLSFSVDRGVRVRYTPYIDPETGKQKVIDGKECWTDLAVADSDFTQDLSKIYSIVFQEKPTNEEIRAMHSFIRLLNIMKTKLPEDKKDNVYLRFIDYLWGAKSQKLSVFDKDEDRAWKEAANDKYLELFPEFKKYEEKVAKEREYFYESFENRARG